MVRKWSAACNSAEVLNKSNSIPAVAEMVANLHCTFSTFTSPIDATIKKAQGTLKQTPFSKVWEKPGLL